MGKPHREVVAWVSSPVAIMEKRQTRRKNGIPFAFAVAVSHLFLSQKFFQGPVPTARIAGIAKITKWIAHLFVADPTWGRRAR